MKNYLLYLFLFTMVSTGVFAQDEFKPGGAPIGVLFFDYKYDLTKDVDQRSMFELDRAYLGYKYNFSQTISGKIVYDIGYDATVKNFSAFVKNAMIDWTVLPTVKLSVGMFGLKMFDTQEKFWNYRYVLRPHADLFGLATSTDIGMNAEIALHKMVTMNLFVQNGEGFKSLQDNFGMHRFGANVVVTPIEGLWLKAHYEMMPNKHAIDANTSVDTCTISNLTLFAGYQMKNIFRLGIEYNQMYNGTTYKKYAEDYNLGGMSVLGAVGINEKWEVLLRYDFIQSNKVGNAADVWNINKDGALMLLGVQYKAAKGVNMALNYRNFQPDNSNNEPTSGLYMNLGFSF